jgi:hypothetical protein
VAEDEWLRAYTLLVLAAELPFDGPYGSGYDDGWRLLDGRLEDALGGRLLTEQLLPADLRPGETRCA